MSKRKWKKQVKEGLTNMSYDRWKLMEDVTKRFFEGKTFDTSWYNGTLQTWPRTIYDNPLLKELEEEDENERF